MQNKNRTITESHNGSYNQQRINNNRTEDRNNINDPKKKYSLETVRKILYWRALTSFTAPSSILAQSHIFVEIDHEIISTAILLPSAESFKKGCCQLQAKVCGRSTD